jgi:hypothetical protein
MKEGGFGSLRCIQRDVCGSRDQIGGSEPHTADLSTESIRTRADDCESLVAKPIDDLLGESLANPEASEAGIYLSHGAVFGPVCQDLCRSLLADSSDLA